MLSKRVYPIILAAGESRRFGELKPLVKFRGDYLVNQAIKNCKKAGLAGPILILGYKAKTILEKVAKKGLIIRINKSYKKGQLSSFLHGLKSLPADANAFMLYPVDYPLLTSKHIKNLVQAFVKNKDPRKKIFCPSYRNEGGHPVLFDISLKKEFLKLPISSTARAVVYKDKNRIKFVRFYNTAILKDFDTPRSL